MSVNYKNESIITNQDLRANKYKYSIEELTKNIKHLSPKAILYTQKLNEEFCARYIVDIRWDTCGDEDTYNLAPCKILEAQLHLNEDLFYEWIEKIYPEYNEN